MDNVFFGVKRAYWASARFSTRVLKPYAITPARIVLMHVIHSTEHGVITQAHLTHRLGVARSVVSRMFAALEELGLVERGPPPERDRRMASCKLTARGRALIDKVWSELVFSKVIARSIDQALEFPKFFRTAASPIFERLTYSYGRWGPVRLP